MIGVSLLIIRLYTRYSITSQEKLMGISSTETPSVEVVIHPNTYSKTSVWIALFFAIVIIGAWLLATPAGVLGKADAVGYAICHRITVRSFEAFDRQLPLCARCTGIYLGVASG
ncbi:MAG: DUF2085 domain-containing protein, partial [Anaerolineae bacterium]